MDLTTVIIVILGLGGGAFLMCLGLHLDNRAAAKREYSRQKVSRKQMTIDETPLTRR